MSNTPHSSGYARQAHKHAALIKAWADGAEVEYCVNQRWFGTTKPSWNPEIPYRLKPNVNPYQEYRDAQAQGKVVQYQRSTGEWMDITNPKFEFGKWFEYRIKPKDDPYQEFKDALKQGKKIEVKDVENKWKVMDTSPWFTSPPQFYRIHDPYREFKDALEAGKQIQWLDDGKWYDVKPEFTESPKSYRIKPTHKWQAVIDAYRNGAKVQWYGNVTKTWQTVHDATHGDSFFSENLEWRVQPVPHKWQHIIDAHKAGAKVQYRYPGTPTWWTPNGEPGFQEHLEWRIAPVITFHDVYFTWAAGSGIRAGTGANDRRVRFTVEDGKIVGVELQ